MKKALAINGGVPIRKNKIYYGRQWIDENDIEAVSNVLRGDYITCGPDIDELEQALSKYTQSRYTVVVSSGTAALHCACIAAGIGPGDEVITTPLTFAASANCVIYCGGTPVFADIDPQTYNIDPTSIEEHITEKTKAVIAVDYAGQAVRINEIRDLCEKHGLLFLEDAAHSIGTKYNNKPVGSLADMTCFSFHPVKSITAGEGGAITTNDAELYKKLLLARSHGITHNPNEFKNEMTIFSDDGREDAAPWYYEELFPGYNYRMTDFQAVLLQRQLTKLDSFKQRRQDIVRKYDEAFSDLAGIITQKEIQETDTCRHLYTIRINNEVLSCSRRLFFESLSAENIQPQVHYIPVYWFPYYRKNGYNYGLCPIAEEVYKSIISIPLYPKMTDEDVNDVISGVKKLQSAYKRGE